MIWYDDLIVFIIIWDMEWDSLKKMYFNLNRHIVKLQVQVKPGSWLCFHEVEYSLHETEYTLHKIEYSLNKIEYSLHETLV